MFFGSVQSTVEQSNRLAVKYTGVAAGVVSPRIGLLFLFWGFEFFLIGLFGFGDWGILGIWGCLGIWGIFDGGDIP